MKKQLKNVSVSPETRSHRSNSMKNQSPDPDRYACYNKLNDKLKKLRSKRVRNYGGTERKWQMSVGEVENHMNRMINKMKQHGKDFEEMTKVSSVDTIKLRNSRILIEPTRPKPFKRRNRELSSLGGDILS